MNRKVNAIVIELARGAVTIGLTPRDTGDADADRREVLGGKSSR
jgi:hypothetical protein